MSADDLAEVIYIDHYGNALTGMRAFNVPQDTPLAVGAVRIPPARVFAEVPTGQAFWYENSVGLVEIDRRQSRQRCVSVGSCRRLAGQTRDLKVS